MNQTSVYRTGRAVAIVLVLATAIGIFVASATQSTGARQEPLPFQAAEESWTDSTGRPIVGLMPDRVPVSTLDGQLLRNADGSLVTAPLGDVARGEISEEAADAQTKAALELQRADACRRGLKVPVGASATGSGTIEDAIAAAKAARLEAIAKNGGSEVVSACNAPTD